MAKRAFKRGKLLNSSHEMEFRSLKCRLPPRDRCPRCLLGSCQDGSLLGSLNDIDNAAECLLECQDVPSCEGFTWDSSTKYCILFDSCTTIEMGTSCTDCVSGMSRSKLAFSHESHDSREYVVRRVLKRIPS